jgi:hypothetical protein
MFNAMYQEYALNPEITKARMYYETISEVLPDVKLYIDTTNGGVEAMLTAFESFAETSTSKKRHRYNRRRAGLMKKKVARILTIVILVIAVIFVASSLYSVRGRRICLYCSFSKIIG